MGLTSRQRPCGNGRCRGISGICGCLARTWTGGRTARDGTGPFAVLCVTLRYRNVHARCGPGVLGPRIRRKVTQRTAKGPDFAATPVRKRPMSEDFGHLRLSGSDPGCENIRRRWGRHSCMSAPERGGRAHRGAGRGLGQSPTAARVLAPARSAVRCRWCPPPRWGPYDRSGVIPDLCRDGAGVPRRRRRGQARRSDAAWSAARCRRVDG